DVVARGVLDAAADALADPVVVVGPQQVAVALEHLLAQRAHLLRPEAWIDAQVLERAVEAVDVLLHLEQPMAEAAGHVEAAVAIDPARIAEWNAHLAFRHELAVEPCDPLVGAYRHLESPSKQRRRPVDRRASTRLADESDQLRSSLAGA